MKKCVICGEDRTLERARIVPGRHGGRHVQDNILPLCPTHHSLMDNKKLNLDEENKVFEYLKNHPIFNDLFSLCPNWRKEKFETCKDCDWRTDPYLPPYCQHVKSRFLEKVARKEVRDRLELERLNINKLFSS